MGKQTVYTDDLDGVALPDGSEPVEVTYDGKAYKVYLSEANQQRFKDFLSGKEPLVRKEAPRRRGAAKKSASSGGSINTHGATPADVREWAIANGIINANGKPVGKAGRLSQAVYDEYRDKAGR